MESVIEFLKAEEARGRSHVYLDDEARAGLRDLFIRARTPLTAAGEEPVEAPSPVVVPPKEAVVSGDSKSAKLQGLREQAERWAPALSLGTLRDKMVFSTGNPDAEIMLVGEAPGYNEEKDGEPFVGPAGQKLNDILKAMGVKREDVYISYLVKFRPAMPKQTTNNRKASSEEMAACLPLFMAEFSVVQPKIIIVLGGGTAECLLGLEGHVTGMREKWHDLSGIPVRVTYHPSHLLQTGGSNEVKRALWEDMLAAMEKLGMPISEKQKGYFLPKA